LVSLIYHVAKEEKKSSVSTMRDQYIFLPYSLRRDSRQPPSHDLHGESLFEATSFSNNLGMPTHTRGLLLFLCRPETALAALLPPVCVLDVLWEPFATGELPAQPAPILLTRAAVHAVAPALLGRRNAAPRLRAPLHSLCSDECVQRIFILPLLSRAATVERLEIAAAAKSSLTSEAFNNLRRLGGDGSRRCCRRICTRADA
jgi:hypothetical protein